MKTRHFLLIAAAFWLLFGLVTGILVWISMLDHGHSVPWLLSYFVIVWFAWIVPTGVILGLTRRFPIGGPRGSVVLVHVAAAMVIAFVHAVDAAL